MNTPKRKKMNANELRIGNWIEIKSAEHWIDKVIELPLIEYYSEKERSNCFKIRIGTKRIQVDEEKAFPIPLTVEIVEKCGFYPLEKKTATGFTRYANNYMELLVDEGENPFKNITAYYEVNLAHQSWLGHRPNLYLHQLQNLYFALTGSELKVNLFEPIN
jgi:hypothetical protein